MRSMFAKNKMLNAFLPD